ncbi:MAG: histidinol-phosphatase [Ruminococcus sp.]|nr:histidinol-phosphatase [Ruminococcus sp.]
MFANYHTHTFRCHHAKGEDREYIEHAIASGFKVLGFADHCPWVYPYAYVSGSRMEPREVDGYFRSLTDLKKEYARDITIYIGFEAEYIPELLEAQDKLLAGYPVDYMILGQHSVGAEPYAPYTGIPDDSEAALTAYVDSVIEGMETGRYVYLAHPDLFNFTGSPAVCDREFRRLCRYLKEHDHPVEINLYGVRDGRNYTSERFLAIARDMGNTAIIGCDAHTPSMLSDNGPIEKCLSLAEKFGLPVVEKLKGLDAAPPLTEPHDMTESFRF